MHYLSNPRFLGLALCILLASACLGYLAIKRDLGFYAPSKGAVVPGSFLEERADITRSIVRLKITETMAGEDGVTTLEELTRFFGLVKSTIPCSIRETDQLFQLEGDTRSLGRHRNRPRKVGDQVTLCLVGIRE